jgi:VWFA-related protein
MKTYFQTALLGLATLLACSIQVGAQKPAVTPTPEPDIIRVKTDLVQTDVMVFDKKGVFVDGLQREQFELLVDGKPQPISFFDRVVAGTSREAEQRAAAYHNGAAATVKPGIEERGRTIVFFIDDFHLSATSLVKTRNAILRFVNGEMGANDQVEIASATGQIGFLQQFTDNKAVLRAAADRLTHKEYTVRDAENITMTEYTAIQIDQGDRSALDYFTTELLKANTFRSPGGGAGPPRGGGAVGTAPPQSEGTNGMPRAMAERAVKERARLLIKQSSSVTMNTLGSLENFLRLASGFSGRKLVFFISDGFYLNDRDTGFGSKLRQLTDAALRTGVVIYSMDARGLVSQVDAASNRSDPTGKLTITNTGELAASQDALNALAEDTGGRALFNSEALNSAVTKALGETSNYYLLAWRPPGEDQKAGNYRRVEVKVTGRPELVVRLPRGYLEEAANAAATKEDARNSKTVKTAAGEEQKSTVESDMITALHAAAPRQNLPTTLSITYLDTPNNGPLLTASVQAATAGLDYGADGKQPASVDLAGVVLNDQGKTVASFKTRLNVGAGSNGSQSAAAGVIYTYKAPLTPGIYQVRTAARDSGSGKLGSSMQWIEIPDLAARRLTLSSLLLGGRELGADKKNEASSSSSQLQFSVDRRFSRSSQLNFWIFVYNAARAANSAVVPEVTAQVQVLHAGQVVVSTQPRKLTPDASTDLARIPYGGSFPLNSLPAGRYYLDVTIKDLTANSSVTQRASFQIE